MGVFYNGWVSNRPHKWRHDAKVDNLFPKERRSMLDVNLLKRLGLDETRVKNCDALFFWQLILPIVDPSKSGVKDDPRSAFYTPVAQFSNLYRLQTGIGNGYGHDCDEEKGYEYVRFDECLVQDGVRGGGDGAMYRRWNSKSPSYDGKMENSLTLHRWFQLKRMFKLCNNDTAKKRGEDGYDPAYKYDFIYRTIVDNVIALTKKAELDLTGDETSWAHQGYGEKGSSLLTRIQNKPGVSKGGQTVIVSATHRIRPYWYQHRHNLNKRWQNEGFGQQGPAEVRSFIDQIGKHIKDHFYAGVGPDAVSAKKIFTEEPHSTWDNHFSGKY